MKSEIIAAKLDHVPQIAALGYRSFKETGSDLPEPNIKKVMETLTNCVLDGMIFIDYNQEEKVIKGFIAITPFNVWWSEYDVIETVLFYIQPEYRSGKTFVKLVKAAKEYADFLQVPLRIEHFNKVDLENKTKATQRWDLNQ